LDHANDVPGLIQSRYDHRNTSNFSALGIQKNLSSFLQLKTMVW
jgi:hypothetical protein